MAHYIFKTANSVAEFESIHRLNYRTFVEEIPQHSPNRQHVLVDPFDKENTYLIALQREELVGMVAVRGNRPFSLDQKINDLDSYLPCHKKLCEIRLLSVEPTHRNGMVFKGLMLELLEHTKQQGYDLAVISGTVRQLKLYENLGFVAFGPRVGSRDALYQPMYLTQKSFTARLTEMSAVPATRLESHVPLNFLPGPVKIKPRVTRAFSNPPISHRSQQFMHLVAKIKQRLSELTNAKSVEILLGSGTLANDAIAWQIKQLDSPGLVLTTGEFGDRLVDHARRAGLDFRVVTISPEVINDEGYLEQACKCQPDVGWLWTVHCETSTGEMFSLSTLKRFCRERQIKLCLDAISTFGMMPIDMREIYFASAVSGKAVGGYPGLAMVFYSHRLLPVRHGIPRYLDLSVYAEKKGVPFTHSSNLMEALDEALAHYPAAQYYGQLEHRAGWLRDELRKIGCQLVSRPGTCSPAVTTITLPKEMDSGRFGDQMARRGCLLSYQSSYLLKRNRVQICLMSDMSRQNLQRLLGQIRTQMRSLQ
jgi:aspartate aminotransferase-like enzyme/ribosomal protein S18 acetylase RimI-like enzyme